jgi:hypothetical protein
MSWGLGPNADVVLFLQSRVPAFSPLAHGPVLFFQFVSVGWGRVRNKALPGSCACLSSRKSSQNVTHAGHNVGTQSNGISLVEGRSHALGQHLVLSRPGVHPSALSP